MENDKLPSKRIVNDSNKTKEELRELAELRRKNAELVKKTTDEECEHANEAPGWSQQLLDTIVDTAPICIKLITADGSLQKMNRAGLDMLQADSFDQVKGRCVYPLVSGEYREAFRDLTETVFKGESGTLEFKMIGLKERPLWLYTHAVPVRDEKGKIVFALATTIDITERKQAEEKIRQSEQFIRSILDSMSDSVWISDADKFRIVDVNNAFLKNYGIKEKAAVIGMTCYEITHCRPDIRSDTCPLAEALKNNLFTDMEHVYISENGEKKVELISGSPIRNEEGDIIQLVHISRDYTERRRRKDELHRMSVTDELTGLLNRRGFYTLGEQQLKLSKRNGKGIYMLYADLDNLKTINDIFGHNEGDAALREAAVIIRECFRDSDVVARIGGDEFAVIPIGVSGDDVEAIIDRFRKKIKSYNNTAKHGYKISFSVGAAYYDPSNPCSMDVLLTLADKMMYEDKKRNKHP